MVRMAQWSMFNEPWQKMELQHTTLVRYGSSCANKHNQLTDTSTQVLCVAKIFGFMSILGWYGQPCHEQ